MTFRGLALAAVAMVAFACGSDRGNGGGDDEDGGFGSDCPLGTECSSIVCSCPDGSIFEPGPRCGESGTCLDPAQVCAQLCPGLSSSSGAGASWSGPSGSGDSGAMGTGASGSGSGASGAMGSGASGASGSGAAPSSSGSGGTDPICIAAADNYCNLCTPDPAYCKTSEAWETYADCYLHTSCPGMYACIAGATSCQAMQSCTCN